MKIFKKPAEFEWDKGNKNKNLVKHKVADTECEEVFFDSNKKFLQDILHSGTEARYILLGQTKFKRLLFVVFAVRNNKIRVTSARDINKKEKKLYEKTS